MRAGQTTRRPVAVAIPCCILATALLASGGAHAAFPGANGRIAYGHDSPGGTFDPHIFSSDPNGANEVQLTNAAADDEEPSYSADGERIVFVRDPAGAVGAHIWVMNHDGSGQTPLTDGQSANDGSPTFSPDGARIAFIRNLPSTGGPQLWIMNADGSDQTQLTFEGPSGDEVSFAAFSPDGQKLVVERHDGLSGDEQLALINADGSGVQPLLTTFEGMPDWSPDGERIIFGEDNVLAVNADGSGQTQITESGDNADYGAVFSPDATRILFHREPAGADPGDLLLADPTGLNLNVTPVTNNPVGEYDYEPTWQPLNPPSCELAGSPTQKSVKSIEVTVTCANENAAVVAEGSGKAPKPKSGAAASKARRFTLEPVSAQAQEGAPTTLTLVVPKKAKKALKKAAKAGKKGKATITVTLTDDLGASSTETFAVKFKKRR